MNNTTNRIMVVLLGCISGEARGSIRELNFIIFDRGESSSS